MCASQVGFASPGKFEGGPNTLFPEPTTGAQRKLLRLRCKRFIPSEPFFGPLEDEVNMYRIIRSLSGLGLLVKKGFLLYQDYGRSFCSLKLVKVGQNHKGSAPATVVGKRPKEMFKFQNL